MPAISIPNAHVIKWSLAGSKNSVAQLIRPGYNLEVNEADVTTTRTNLRVTIEDTSLLLSRSPENVDEDEQLVIKTNVRPTLERITNNEIRFDWFKFPNNTGYDVESVVDSWHRALDYVEEDLASGVNGFRTPQIGAIHAILSHFINYTQPGTIVLPTGTGKTETMLATMIAGQFSRLLVIVPTDPLRTQIAKKFFSLGLLKKLGLADENALYPNTGIIRQKFAEIEQLEDFISSSNVIIATADVLSGFSDAHNQILAQHLTHVFIDEAHHERAASWSKLKGTFKDCRVVQFTATPFRNDRKRLDGKIIFNYPLSKAQEEGYFKPIEFIAIEEFDNNNADKAIAEAAVNRLLEDKKKYPHILLARCQNKVRAEKIFNIYSEFDGINPVLMHSSVKGRKEKLQKIVSGEYDVIVAVDMLGEGFDLPQLKIAAFHDIRKSLPITLQFAGRFTRTSIDDQLGNASFIANLADIEFKQELDELYAQDANWNQLLPILSANRIDDEVNFHEFLQGFNQQNLDDLVIPIQNIRIPLSTVVYRNNTNEWFPTNFENGINQIDNYDFIHSNLNRDVQTLVIVTAQKINVDWGNFNDINNQQWNIIVAYWETHNNLLFIHGSDKKGLYKELATALIGENHQIINQINVFRAFHGLNRITLNNVGLKEYLGKNIRFRMSAGADVEEALTMAEQRRGEKAFVFGSAYENGNKVSLGCSYKGRVWSHMRGDLRYFLNWCNNLGAKLVNNAIDPNQILRDTLIPDLVTERPNKYPCWIDWDEEMYQNSETKFSFVTPHGSYNLSNCDIVIAEPSLDQELCFDIVTHDEHSYRCRLRLFVNQVEDEFNEGNLEYPDFEILNESGHQIIVRFGTKEINLSQFLYKFTPTIWFIDGASLTGNKYVELRQDIGHYDREKIIVGNWDGVDISREAQRVNPKVTDSIQYKFIQDLQATDCEIIYDDDGKGEIADIVTLKVAENTLEISLYHLKYAHDGEVNNRIDNLYEVCGQAQKSMNWKYRDPNEIFRHMRRRMIKRHGGNQCERLEKGTLDDLNRIANMVKNQIPIHFSMQIVQPSISKANCTQEMLSLLGVTEGYLKELSGIDLSVVGSE